MGLKEHCSAVHLSCIVSSRISSYGNQGPDEVFAGCCTKSNQGKRQSSGLHRSSAGNRRKHVPLSIYDHDSRESFWHLQQSDKRGWRGDITYNWYAHSHASSHGKWHQACLCLRRKASRVEARRTRGSSGQSSREQSKPGKGKRVRRSGGHSQGQ